MDTHTFYSISNAIIGTAGLIAFFCFNTYQRIERIKVSAKMSESRKRKIKGWNRTPAVITAVAIDYPYYDPDLRPRGYSAATKNPELLISFLKKEKARAEAFSARAGQSGIMASYVYPVEGVSFTGDQLAPGLTEDDRYLIYRIRPGQKLSIYVNPDNPNEAYVWPESPGFKMRIEEQLNRAWAQLLIGSGIILLSSIFFYFDVVVK